MTQRGSDPAYDHNVALRIGTRYKIALARVAQRAVMAVRRMRGAGSSTQATRRGVRWELDLDEGIDFSIWLLGVFEPSMVRQYSTLLRDGAVAIDVGANIGSHTLHLARAVGIRGRVVAVEPTDFAFAKLNRNIALNPDLEPRIAAVQAMLVERESPAVPDPVYSSWPLVGAGDKHPLHLGALKSCTGARSTSLDALVTMLRLERIDLIKIDIDGYECTMLRGAQRTLCRFRPRIVMELAPYVLEERGASLGELLELLAGAGYALGDLASAASLPLDAARLGRLIPRGGSINVLVTPT